MPTKDQTETNETMFSRLWKTSPLIAIMAAGIIWQDSKFETYREENNQRVTGLENQLEDCNNGRIQDLKLIHTKRGMVVQFPEKLFALKPKEDEEELN